MDKITEKINYRYALALDNGQYLKSLHMGKYAFTNDIEMCTKFISRSAAENYIQYFYNDTGMIDIYLFPVKVEITYNLIKEEIG